MAEPRDDSQPQIDDGLAAAAGTDAAAVALGLSRRRGRGADPRMDAFLDNQTRLLGLQAEHLHEQREVTLSRLLLGRWKDRVTLALQLMTALVGLAVAAGVGVMAWQAHDDHGLTIAAFSVPPDLAQRGLTGQVIASQVLDRLEEMQVRTVSSRPAGSYKNDWGDDIKVEIPQTGVSVGELYRSLRQWLGHGTRINGEVYRTADGVAITARAGGAPGATAKGTEADLDRLVQQAAEAVYGETQPYRYAAYLTSSGRTQEGVAAFQRLAASGPALERGWAHMALAGVLYGQGDNQGAVREAAVAEALAPRLVQPHGTSASALQGGGGLGHDEAALQEWRRGAALTRSGRPIDIQASARKSLVLGFDAAGAQLLGDFRTAAADTGFGEGPVEASGTFSFTPLIVRILALGHDLGGARRAMSQGGTLEGTFGLSAEREHAVLDEATGDWPGVVAELERLRANLIAAGPSQRTPLERALEPWLALAYAHTARQAEAEALIASSPLDCDECVLARGQIAAARGDWAGAARWFAMTAQRTPSLPFANFEWARMLMAKGDVGAAIARLKLANQAGPHYADVLELWGEALMRQGDFRGAAAKFRAADENAPHWGRNHLRWGEALARQGEADAAQAQWRTAAALDLSVADRAELARTPDGAPHT